MSSKPNRPAADTSCRMVQGLLDMHRNKSSKFGQLLDAKVAGHRQMGWVTMIEPPSVKSKLIMEDEKICSSGLYVTN